MRYTLTVLGLATLHAGDPTITDLLICSGLRSALLSAFFPGRDTEMLQQILPPLPALGLGPRAKTQQEAIAA